MSRITLGGLATGMDTDTMIDKILKAEQDRITAQNAKKTKLEAKRTAWNDIADSLTTLRGKLDAIRFSSAFRARSATISDDTTATVTASAGATLTTHKLTVSTLASAHSVAGDSDVSDPDAALGMSGQFTIQVDTATAVTIDVTTSDSLNTICDNIQAKAGTQVTAEVVKVQDPATFADRYRLVLTSKTSGADGSVNLTEVSGGVLQATTGLGFFADGTSTVPAGQELAQAQDAVFMLDNVNYHMSSNTISDVVPGLSITLLDDDNTERTITVTQDPDSTVEGVQAWVDALNDTLELITEKTAKEGTDGKPAALYGDTTASQLLSTLRGMISNQLATADTDYDSMSDVGITTGAWGSEDYGKVVFDSDKLIDKLGSDEDAVARLFGALRTNLALSRNNSSATYSATSEDIPADTYGAANAFNDISSADRWGTVGGGWQSLDIPSATTQYLMLNLGSAKTIDQIRLYLPTDVATSGLRDFALQYSTDSTNGTDGTWTTLESVTDNKKTLGVFDFQPVRAKWVRLEVTNTYGDNKAKVSEMQVLEYSNAAPLTMYNYTNRSLTSSTGTVSMQSDSLTDQISEIDESIEKMLTQLDSKEQSLRERFARMEAAVSKLQAQGGALVSQLLGSK